MKKTILLLVINVISLIGFAQVTTVPTVPQANAAVTLKFNKVGTPLATYTGTIYAHIGVTVNGTTWQYVKGAWGNNTTQPALTLESGTTYKLDLTPNLYSYFGVPTTSTITQICVVFRSATGTQQSTDNFINVGGFQMSLTTPVQNSNTIIASGSNFTVSANNTGGNATYVLKANGTTISTTSTASYSYTHTNITTNTNYELVATLGSSSITKKFSVIVNPGTITGTLPAGMIDGINYNITDATKATLVLDAPGKDFVYVAGSFNNWQPGSNYIMKKDTASGKFWLELTGLVSGQDYSYQYWVVDTTPLAGSPAVVKTADPYSTLVLSPVDDLTIPATTYPNLPAYPVGQEREVTVLKTGQAPYNWQATNFVRPAKEDLVVYEVLVRDFDVDRNYQDLIDKIDYFKNLKINAIELLPVMEFEGNESWGYNTSFHMALDKFYGPSTKLKELIDLCHQNGIAVILDVALNHAFGRNPMVRMWMSDPDGDGYGEPTAENPYFNVAAMHSYSVGSDFNHSLDRTKNYVKRVVKQWIEEYHIDGFRWDLTKGFTQECPANVAGGQEVCTNASHADRIAILKEYADYSWSLDPTHYTIFEHLGTDAEEQQWANYRINETPSKGVMMWGLMTNPYNQLSMGYNSNADITRMGNVARGFTAKRVMGYAESHDEERLMYKNVQYGNSTNTAHDVKNLNVALSRMSAIGAISLLVPGPKMIWHFGELGWQSSIFTCNNGTVNSPSDATTGDCKLDTKPQPQWSANWLADVNRNKIYTDWAKMINLKKNEPVFKGTYTINSGATNLTPKLYVTNATLPSTQLSSVVVLTNFNVTSQNVVANFPSSGTWYDLMDNTPFAVSSVGMTVTIAPGQFRVFGNKQGLLGIDTDNSIVSKVSLSPNPASAYFTISTATTSVQVFSITGQLVKSFESAFTNESQFDISSLKAGIYIVKALDNNNREVTMKLIKE